MPGTGRQSNGTCPRNAASLLTPSTSARNLDSTLLVLIKSLRTRACPGMPDAQVLRTNPQCQNTSMFVMVPRDIFRIGAAMVFGQRLLDLGGRGCGLTDGTLLSPSTHLPYNAIHGGMASRDHGNSGTWEEAPGVPQAYSVARTLVPRSLVPQSTAPHLDVKLDRERFRPPQAWEELNQPKKRILIHHSYWPLSNSPWMKQ